MAAHPVVVVHDCKVEIPEALRNDPRFHDGACVQLIPVVEASTSEGASEVLARWERLAGIFAGSDYDPNSELEREKQKELEDEARWLRS